MATVNPPAHTPPPPIAPTVGTQVDPREGLAMKALQDGIRDALTGPAKPGAKLPAAKNAQPALFLVDRAASVVAKGKGEGAELGAKELIRGLEAESFDCLFDEKQARRLIAAFDADGSGGLSADELTQAFANNVVDFGAGTASLRSASTLDKAAAIAGFVVRAGSDNDAWANRKELEKGFEAAGYTVVSENDQMDRLIAIYGVSGSGALTAEELEAAVRDRAIVLLPDGSADVDERVLQRQVTAHADNIASRVVDSGSHADTADRKELEKGLRNAGCEFKGDSEALGWVIDTFGDAVTGEISKAQLASAIARGALNIDPRGTVWVNREITAVPAGPRGIDDPFVGGGAPGTGVVVVGTPVKVPPALPSSPGFAT